MARLFRYLFLGIALLTTVSGFAQSYEDKNISLGLTVNPNIGWFNFDDDSDVKGESKAGFSYGLIADIGFARNYYFSTGLLINTLKGRMEYPQNASSVSRDIRLQYAEIPLAIKMKTSSMNTARYYGQFGLTTGIKVSSKETLDDGEKSRGIDGASLLRLGLQIGGGVEWRLDNNLAVLTGISYNNGFTKAFDEGKPKVSYFGLNIGLLF
ncbi:porin family protein [Sphingobacterium sp. SYP-B4668]|uniref:porin family protein n=1 Tax=Sphingobacterium sp. SYP-B4668 TaxID=2996035 RepID=UPI0005323760|nr:porin family protein [Sphingobacterium sp. SYP-B4668]